MFSPLHGYPPLLGNGLSQMRVRTVVPSPHVAEHEEGVGQAPQPPLTATKRKRVCEYFKFENI
ncbi:hypothetical protein DPMN_125232 [Dreissena polymorpha]|uniref:Uncharacterized protein n=1 Tax=Dreissena polymorpha TaxID=45954 RepID=A0A9D4GUX7_DREPO|nr:hypothetical protein DPMN_125232 [Dreissena polymorpha]